MRPVRGDAFADRFPTALGSRAWAALLTAVGASRLGPLARPPAWASCRPACGPLAAQCSSHDFSSESSIVRHGRLVANELEQGHVHAWAPLKDFSELYGEMSGKGASASASEAHLGARLLIGSLRQTVTKPPLMRWSRGLERCPEGAENQRRRRVSQRENGAARPGAAWPPP